MEKENKIFLAIILGALIIGVALLGTRLVSNKTDSSNSVTGKITSSNFLGNKTVTKIIDGDTVIIEGESVRLLGIDADEKTYPCYESAKKRIEELILSKEVELEKDVEDKDQYRRYLRYIFLDNKNINLQLVQEGLAVARFSPENTKYKKEIIEAEKQAQEKKIGCKWGEESIKQEYYAENKWEWRKLTKDIIDLDVIGACNAGNYINKKIIVQGKIVDVYKSKTSTVFLNFEKPYPNSCFVAVIFSGELYKFPESIEDYFEGREVRVIGTIKEYRGKPEVILNSLEQVEVGS